MAVSIERKQPNSRMCFVCGTENGYGLKSKFFELANGDLLAIFNPAEEHQGYPGRLHGGLAATILDEAIGRSIMIRHTDNIWGVTIEFKVKYRKPVPLDEEVRVVCRITEDGRRTFEGTGEIVLSDGTVAIEGRGRYLKMDIDKIADFDHEGDEWFIVHDPDDPSGI